MPEQIRRLGRLPALPGPRRGQPQPLPGQLLAVLLDPRSVAREHGRDRRHTELDTANGRGGEQLALLAAEFGHEVLDDGGQSFRHRQTGEPRSNPSIFVALLGAGGDVAQHGGHEQRDTVGSLVQGTHERFVAGQRWRQLRHDVGNLRFRERIEHDLLAQPMQP